MKKIIIAIAIIATLGAIYFVQDKPKPQKALVLVKGKFAFCGASGAELTGRTIEVQGKKFLEGKSICPVLDGISLAQAPTWDLLPTVNRSFVITKTQGMSNMFCMPCKVLKDKVNGVTLAECLGPLNEAAVPLRRALRVVDGETSITQAPEGASYPVGTIIPVQGL